MPHNCMVQNITSIGVTTSDCRTEAGPTLLWMDTGAGDSASSGGHCELKYNRVHSRLHPREADPYYFTVHGATVLCDLQRHVLQHAGWRAADRASAGEQCGAAFRAAAQGSVHTRYTICARRGMSTLAEGAALRANLGRMRSSARELTGARTTGARTRRAEARPQDHGLGLAVVCTLQHWGCGHTPSLETCVPRQRSCTCGR